MGTELAGGKHGPVFGVVGGAVGAAVGLCGGVLNALAIHDGIQARAVVLVIALGPLLLIEVFFVVVFLIGVFAIRDARRDRNGHSAARLWLLFGLGAALAIAAFVVDRSVPSAVGFGAFLAAATPNFLAWRRRAR